MNNKQTPTEARKGAEYARAGYQYRRRYPGPFMRGVYVVALIAAVLLVLL